MDSKNNDCLITFLNTNARSLGPKKDSLIDNLRELECQFAVITETWFTDGQRLEDGLRNLEDGAGSESLVLNRKGKVGGGVALLARKSVATLKEFKVHNPGGYELL